MGKLRISDGIDVHYGSITAKGGIDGLTSSSGISGSNFNITGVNQLSINDPGEGIVFGGGSSGNITLAIVDDSSDNKLRLSGTGATLQVGTNNVFHDGYHPNADAWTTSRTITLAGDLSGSVSIDGSGDVTLTASVNDDSHDLTWANIDGETANSVNSWGGLRHQTNDGYIDFGPANTSWAHIYTDRPNFYFNKNLYVNNYLVWNAGNDGANSGLDADKLDGQQGTSYFRNNYTSGGDLNTDSASGIYRFNSTESNRPGSITYGTLVTFNNTSDTGFQLVGDYHNTGLYWRGGNSSTFGGSGTNTSWFKIWHDGNDGSSSGLDADKVDGVHASSFLRSDTDDTFGSTSANRYIRFNCNSGQYIASGGSSSRFPIEIFAPTANGGDAGITFHISSDYAGFFGLASDWNDLAWGGWSVGSSTKYRILHTGNYSSWNRDDRYYTESESDSRFTSKDHFRHTGHGNYTSTTTSALLTEALGDDAFDSKLTAHKTSWSYAGNGNLTDAGRLTELAGTSWLWWTDNSTDNVQGNITGLCIAPNTGGSANKVFIYNNQGSGYSPGWREVWTNASDGAGSGLDADLLDGQQGSYYLDYNNFTNTPTSSGISQSDADTRYVNVTGDTMTGNLQLGSNQLIFNNGYGNPTIKTYYGSLNITLGSSAGVVYVGTGSGNASGSIYAITQGGSSNSKVVYNNTYHSYYVGSSTEEMRLESDGDLHLERDVIAYSTTVSDIRLKDDVVTIDNALDKVCKLRGVEYTWNKGGRKDKRDLGVIAQEVEKVLPEIVKEKKMPLMDDSDTVYKTVDYEKLSAVLIEAVKEQQAQIDELTTILEQLTKQLNNGNNI